MKSIDPNKRIILDADVIIHFTKGEAIGLLPRIFPNKMFIPNIVYQEALSQRFRIEIDNLFNFKLVEELDIKAEFDVYKEFKRLQSIGLGKGESSCLAYCRYHNDVIGSSNLKDIRHYCEENNIVYLTTMDFLAEAYRTEKMDEAVCDFFIYNVKLKGSRLPCDTIAEFLQNG